MRRLLALAQPRPVLLGSQVLQCCNPAEAPAEVPKDILSDDAVKMSFCDT